MGALNRSSIGRNTDNNRAYSTDGNATLPTYSESIGHTTRAKGKANEIGLARSEAGQPNAIFVASRSEIWVV